MDKFSNAVFYLPKADKRVPVDFSNKKHMKLWNLLSLPQEQKESLASGGRSYKRTLRRISRNIDLNHNGRFTEIEAQLGSQAKGSEEIKYRAVRKDGADQYKEVEEKKKEEVSK